MEKEYGFVDLICDLTFRFPDDEHYGLVSQKQRTAIFLQIQQNGLKKRDKGLIQFLMIALSFLSELEPQHLISIRLQFVGEH